jgi:iron complex outermembrane receptor protein
MTLLLGFTFVLSTLAPAPETLETAAAPLTAPAEDTDIDELLSLSMQEKKDVSVSAASKYAQRAKKTAANVTIITREELRRHQYQTVPDALRGVAGMFTSYDGLYQFLNVRGFGLLSDWNTRILLLLDGRPMNAGFGTGGVHDLHVDMESIDRIEVIKGPGGSIYGTGAFFAVINVITVAPDDPEADAVTLRASASRLGEAMASNGGKSGDISWFVTANGRRELGEERYFAVYDPARAGSVDRAAHGGISDKDREDAGGAYGRVAWKGLSFSIYGASRDKQMPDAEFESDFNAPSHSQDQRYFAEAAYQDEFGPVRILARAFTDYARWDDFLRYTGDGLYRDIVDDRYSGGEVRSVWKLPGGNTLLTGVEGSRHADRLPSGFLGDFRNQIQSGKAFWYSSALVYGQDDWQANRYLLFSAGAQANLNTLYRPAFLPRLGMVVTPAEAHTVKLLYGQGIRQPTIFERSFKDFNSFIDNEKLEPERIRTTELIYEVYPLEWMRTQVSAYYNAYNGLISDRQVEIAPDEFRSQFFNKRGYQSKGVELTLGAELPRGWKGELNGAAQDVHSEVTDRRAENSPTFVESILVSGPLGTEDVVLAVDWNFLSSRSLADRSVTVGAYHVGNAALRYQTPFKPVNVGLRVTNLLDREYADLIATDHDPITKFPQRGRNGILQVEYLY